jgi:hypothetical protein
MLRNSTVSFKKVMFSCVMILALSVYVNAQESGNIELKITDSKGNKVWTYKESNTLYIVAKSRSLNMKADAKDEVVVTAICEMEKDGESFKLTETAINSGIFKGELKLKESPMPFPNSGFLEVLKGDRISVSYLISTDEKGVPETAADEVYYRGPDWTFYNTGQNHIVLIPDGASITIDGEPIKQGDFISVYYKHGEGEDGKMANCGGMGRETSPAGVRFTGATIAIAVWGTQDGKDNGLEVNEKMNWRIWRASDGKVYNAVATYIPIMEGQPFTHQDMYAKDGISGLTALTATSKK